MFITIVMPSMEQHYINHASRPMGLSILSDTESNRYCVKSRVLTIFRKVATAVTYIIWFTMHS